MPNESLFSKCFKFDRTEGVLGIKDKHKINMTFVSSMLGEFSEIFRWVLKDTNEYITMNFKGNVIAPTFEFDVEKINFNLVSFNFD